MGKSNGNMYDWVGPRWNPIAGKCPHECVYCYVQAMAKSKPVIREKYSGPIRICDQKIPKGGPVFVCSCNDIAAEGIPGEVWNEVMNRMEADREPGREWVVQSKNPGRMGTMFTNMWTIGRLRNVILGTTIETNRDTRDISKAPSPRERAEAMSAISTWRGDGQKMFVTIEPILDFDLSEFVLMIKMAGPSWINIGYDSKSTPGLPTPDRQKIVQLLLAFEREGLEVRVKSNLQKLFM